MIFDGKTFATRRREVVLNARAALGHLSLGVVVSSDDPVTSSFVRIKERNASVLNIALVRYEVPEGGGVATVRHAIADASKEDGIIVQLPIPHVSADEVLDAIPPEKDVDALSPELVTRLEGGDLSVIPPVASAIKEIIQTENISVQGKKVVVVGRGRLVGAPSAMLLTHLGASVVVVDKSNEVSAHTKDADIIVLGAGSPHILTPSMVTDGVVIFDAGTSESGGVVVGDAHPDCSEKASFFTPVPGGIGPVAVVEIFHNLVTLAKDK